MWESRKRRGLLRFSEIDVGAAKSCSFVGSLFFNSTLQVCDSTVL